MGESRIENVLKKIHIDPYTIPLNSLQKFPRIYMFLFVLCGTSLVDAATL